MMYGINKIVFVQTILNAKRKKRKSKGNFKHHKNILPQIIYIFKTGKLIKNTHYKEIDPYWGVIWRQYEYLRYLEIYIKLIIDKKLNNKKLYTIFIEEINELITYLFIINKLLKNFTRWMFNAFFIQIGGVINSRFFGWKKYTEKFVGTFYEIAIENINKLRFDINKTRCSVYFYQAFWLSGLAIVNQIQQMKEKEKQIENDYNRGNKLLSTNFNNNYIDSYIDSTYDEYSEEHNEKQIKEYEEIDTISEHEESVDIQELDNYVIEDIFDKEEDIKDKAIQVIRNIMEKMNIPLTIFYNEKSNNNERIINMIASKIKRKLRHNEISLSDEEYEILRKYLGKSITNFN